MVYSNFTLSKVKAGFGIVTNETQDVFAETWAIAPSELLTLTIKDSATTCQCDQHRKCSV